MATTTRSIPATRLAASMVLVGDQGGTSTIYEVSRSSALPGLLAVETEHGYLYLDPDESFSVQVDTATSSV